MISHMTNTDYQKYRNPERMPMFSIFEAGHANNESLNAIVNGVEH